MLVVGFYNDRIQIFDHKGNFSSQFGAEGHEFGQLYYPTDVVVDGEGNIIVADAYNHRLQKFSSDGRPLQSWGSWSGEEGQPGQFNVANALELDSNGRIYVSDFYNNRIQVFDSEGNFLFQFGDAADEGKLQKPTDVAVSPDGFAYVIDFGNDRIVKFRLR